VINSPAPIIAAAPKAFKFNKFFTRPPVIGWLRFKLICLAIFILTFRDVNENESDHGHTSGFL
jgi:hypothetical protein